MASVRAVATAAASTANPLTVGKPAGLTAGDLLVLFAFTYQGLPSGDPSGFTLREQLQSGYHAVTLWTKTADAEDVAASGFDIPNASTKKTAAIIYAVQDPGSTTYDGSAANTAVGDASAAGFDPTQANALLICGAEADYGAANPTFATTNNDPSWTADWANASYARYAGAHATYGPASDSGNVLAAAADGAKTFAYLAVEPSDTPPPEATPDLFLDGVWG